MVKSDTIVERILDLAMAAPDASFAKIVREGKTRDLSRGEAWINIARYSHGLCDAGVTPGEIVVVMLPHGWPQQASFLGAMSMGAIPSFMAPPSDKQAQHIYWSSLTELMKRIRPRLIVVEQWLVDATREACSIEDTTIVTPEAVYSREAEEPVMNEAGPDSIALLQHSSGTTGLKKGVALTHRAVLRQIDAYAKRLQLDPSRHRIATWLPLYHDMGLIACFLMPVTMGVPFVGLDPFEWVARPWLLLEAIEQNRCTHVWMPNFAFHQISRTRGDRRFSLEHVAAFINCSEPCRVETHDLFAEKFADCGIEPEQLQVCYAMAETVFAVTQTEIGTPPRQIKLDQPVGSDQLGDSTSGGLESRTVLSVGRAIDGVKIAIVSEDDEPLEDGKIGEVVISAPFLFFEYHLDAAKTQEKLRDGNYYTGDLGLLQGDELFVLGRSDDLIISRGRNFLAHEIEYAAHGIDGLRPGRSVVFGYDDPGLGTQAIALIFETEMGSDRDARALARAVKDRVWQECDLVLNRVVPVQPGWLIKTSSGKISRESNRAQFLHEFQMT